MLVYDNIWHWMQEKNGVERRTVGLVLRSESTTRNWLAICCFIRVFCVTGTTYTQNPRQRRHSIPLQPKIKAQQSPQSQLAQLGVLRPIPDRCFYRGVDAVDEAGGGDQAAH
jgi:hypothetical protein